MEIKISNQSTLSQIQATFKSYFPFLKLVFFNANLDKAHLFTKENIISDNSGKLGEISHSNAEGMLNINDAQKVSDFEQHFKEQFGVHVQVFRKSGTAWLQTNATDEWTLAEQNKQGEESSVGSQGVAEDNFDEYHEQL